MIDGIAAFVRRHLLWLLMACYALAIVWPAPGIALRAWQWSSYQIANVPVVSLLLLAVLLFIAASLTELNELRIVSHHPLILVAALACVWLGPAMLVVVAGWVTPATIAGQSTSGLLIGFAIVASMPVANSSVGWTQTAGGNLGLGIALVVVSILISPWLTPGLLSLLGMSLGENRADSEALVAQFSGWFFIVWVILPTAAGLGCRLWLTPPRIEAQRPALSIASALALLALNYVNSVLALPKAYHSPAAVLFATTLAATSLAAIGVALGWLMARLFQLRPETRTALMFGLSMKHTGLALLLAGAALTDQPLAILLIVLATLMQHILAGVVQWVLGRPAR